jgi:hypothetical protein
MVIPGRFPDTRTLPRGRLRGITQVRAAAVRDAVWPGGFRETIAPNELPTVILCGGDDRILPVDMAPRRSGEAATEDILNACGED